MPTQDTWIYLAFIARNEKKFEKKICTKSVACWPYIPARPKIT